MQTIRRLYLYAVAFVSLETVLWGLIALLRQVFSAGIVLPPEAGLVASALAYILVGGPVFVLHWWLAQRSAARDDEERYSRLRAIFLYATLLATLIPLVQNLIALVDHFLLLWLQSGAENAIWGGGQRPADYLSAMAVNALAAFYIYTVLLSNWQLRAASDAPAAVPGDEFWETRRLYRYLWLVYSLGLSVAGVEQILEIILKTGNPAGGGRASLANGLALLLIGAPLWLFATRTIRNALAELSERQSLLRLVVLYLLSFIGVIGVLVFGGVALAALLRVLLGERLPLSQILEPIALELALLVPLAGVWVFYGRMLNVEMSAVPDAPRRDGLRRLYFYVLALLGLAAAFIGLHLLLGFILDLALGFPSPDMRSRLATALAALLIGLPLWWLDWRIIVREAAREDEAGDLARRSTLRRSYLFLVLFVAVMGVMLTAGLLFYGLLRSALGDRPASLLLDSLQSLKQLLLFAGLLVYHALALRRDSQLAGRAVSRRYALYPVLVLTLEEPEAQESNRTGFADAIVAALERQVPGLPVAVHPAGQGVPDASLEVARAVILPAELVARPSEALRLWLQNFSGPRLVVPLPARGWHWVFGSGRPLVVLARQVARIVRQMAEGQEIPAARENSPWMMVVYILAGVAALQIAALLASALLSLINITP